MTPSGVEFNLAQAVELVAAAFPDRPASIGPSRRRSFAEFTGRTRRLAGLLAARGLGCFAERSELAGHEAGQHLMAQYLHNGPEYLEGMIGAYQARVAPFNVNYKYGVGELRYLLADARPAAIQFHSCFAPVLRRALGAGLHDVLLLQVEDGSGEELVPGALDYEQALAAAQPVAGVVAHPDDLYVLYTGGTTGKPKGVLWRQADIAVAACGLTDRRNQREWASAEAFVGGLAPAGTRVMAGAPLMHGAAQWGALQALTSGNAVVFGRRPQRFDPGDVLETVHREQVTQLGIVGDAFAVPLIRELERRPRALDSLRYLVTGGAALQPAHKQRLLDAVPGLRIIETVGSSESGIQGRAEARDRAAAGVSGFVRTAGTTVLSEDRRSVLLPGHTGLGWLATRGRVPLGYLGDSERTRQMFARIDGERFSVPGDRARLSSGGVVELVGRESTTVNSGGEKIFTEEVEAAVKSHSAVADAVVCGRPSGRWGSEVVAVVALHPGHSVTGGQLQEWCRGRIAAFKVPRAIVFVPAVERSPAGKPNYRWAAEQALRGQPGGFR